MRKFTGDCKPPLAPQAKCLKYGSGGGTRTPDTRIMIPSVTLISNSIFVNPCPNPSTLTDARRSAVNRASDEMSVNLTPRFSAASRQIVGKTDTFPFKELAIVEKTNDGV